MKGCICLTVSLTLSVCLSVYLSSLYNTDIYLSIYSSLSQTLPPSLTLCLCLRTTCGAPAISTPAQSTFTLLAVVTSLLYIALSGIVN